LFRFSPKHASFSLCRSVSAKCEQIKYAYPSRSRQVVAAAVVVVRLVGDSDFFVAVVLAVVVDV
jgi:hypothetical protein